MPHTADICPFQKNSIDAGEYPRQRPLNSAVLDCAWLRPNRGIHVLFVISRNAVLDSANASKNLKATQNLNIVGPF